MIDIIISTVVNSINGLKNGVRLKCKKFFMRKTLAWVVV